MPISPKMCILLTWDKRQDTSLDNNLMSIYALNNMLLNEAQHFVVSASSTLQLMPTL